MTTISSTPCLLLKMVVQYLLCTIKSRLADSKRGAKVLAVFEVQLLHLIKHLEGETVDPGKYANLSGGCELVELVDISRTGRRREADFCALLFAGPSADGSPR